MSSSLAEAQLEWAELSRLLVLRVGIAVPDRARRSVERGVANAMEATEGRWHLPAERRPALARQAEGAGWKAADDVARKLAVQLGLDLEHQPPVPVSLLALARPAVHYPAGVLRRAGVPPAQRDRAAKRLFPFDVYGIVPRSLAELHPLLPELAQACEQARLAVLVCRLGGYRSTFSTAARPPATPGTALAL